MKLFNKSQSGFVFADIEGFASHASWLKIGQFQDQTVKLDFWSGDFQRNLFGFAGFGRPVKEFQFGIARRDALGIDRTPRVFDDLQKQQFCTCWFERNLRPQTEKKCFVDAGDWRKTFLGLGSEAKADQAGNQKFGFHGSRLSAKSLIDVRK